MASWKKVLVSGSSIEVNQITASGVPLLDNESHLLAIDSVTGGITQITQENVAGTNAAFNIAGFAQGTESIDNFVSGVDYLKFQVTNPSNVAPTSPGDVNNYGFGFRVINEADAEGNNTSSISLKVPQDLQTTAKPLFASITASGDITHNGDLDTKISFSSDKIDFHAGGLHLLSLVEDTTNNVVINQGGNDVDFRVEGDNNAHLLFTDAGEDKVAIGTATVDTNSLLTVVGTIHATGITSSLPTNTDSITVIVDGGSGQLEKRDISSAISGAIDAATASFSASIIGTANEIGVTTDSSGNIVIGLTDDVTIPGDLTVTSDTSLGNNLDLTGGNVTISGNISASGDITASNIRVDNDIALGGNIFSFSGFSFIEGVSANFTGSNVFGSGSTPAANDTAGGGIAHQFTGSVGITGSALTITDGDLSLDNGSITANNGTGSFGYLTALEISSSGHLYASLSNDDSLVTDVVVVYDNATGQFFTTASSGVGVTDYNDLTGIPDLIVSGAITLAQNTNGLGAIQGEYELLVGGVVVDDNISAGLEIGDSPQFTNLNLTGNLTASGAISASSNLFASLSLDSTTAFRTVVYDPTTGQFHSTGSYGGGGATGDYTTLNNIPSGIISGSTFSSNNQGGVTASINDVSQSFDVGLTSTDSPIFDTITATGNISVAGTSTLTGNTTIAGNLTVEGSTTTISTTDLSIEDKFILLASGSTSATTAGIIVCRDAAGTGTALFWDATAQMWSIDVKEASSTANSATTDLKVVTVGHNTVLPATPEGGGATYGNVDDNHQRGQLFIDTDDDYGFYVYV